MELGDHPNVGALRQVVISDGVRGSWCWESTLGSGKEPIHQPAFAVDVVDTTGAGDAFVGCFAATYISSGDIDSSIQRAVRYASHSVTGRGTQTSYATASAFDSWQASI